MRYDFDKVINRKNTDSMKWDYAEKRFGSKEVLPMWVADMDFEAPLPVVEAVKKRAEHGIYGYTERPESCSEAIVDWAKKRHGWDVKKEWLSFCPGVVPALSMAILAFTQPGDKVIVQSPVYYPFFNVIKNNGRYIVDNQLKLENGDYVMDFEDLEKKIDSRVKMAILCSPHNPVGRVWSREELERFGEICLKHNIIIMSDEIHSDLVFKGFKHIPIASISEELAQNTLTCIAPSKTFNIAGLSTSLLITPNKKLRSHFNNVLENLGIEMGNIFGITAMEAAYRHGGEWLDQLIDYVESNMDFLESYTKEKIPSIKFIKPQGTYLAWLDCRGLGMDQNTLKKFMAQTARVGLNDGTVFGPGGEGFMRMNLGCPKSLLEEGLKRVENALR